MTIINNDAVLRYPKQNSNDELIQFFFNISSLHFHGSSKVIQKQKVIIISNDENKLNRFLTSFPISYFMLVGVSRDGKLKTYLNLEEGESLNAADLIFNLTDEPVEIEMIKEKIIKIEEVTLSEKYSLALRSAKRKYFQYSFGGCNENKPVLVFVPSYTNGIFWNADREQIFYDNFIDSFDITADYKYIMNELISPKELGTADVYDTIFNSYGINVEEAYSSRTCIFLPASSFKSRAVHISRFSKIIIEKRDQLLSALIGNKLEKTIGISLRGTDYVRYPWHQIPFDGHEAVEITKKYLIHKKLQYVFLMTEDQDVFEIFKKSFGKKLISLSRTRYTKENVFSSGKESNTYQKCVDYILEVLIIASLRIVLSGPGSAPISAYMDGNSEYIRCLQKNPHLLYGECPIAIESYNRNRLSLSTFRSYTNGDFSIVEEDGIIKIKGKLQHELTHYIVINQPIHLIKGEIYSHLFEMNELYDVVFEFKGESGKVFRKNLQNTFEFIDNIVLVSIYLKLSAGLYNLTITPQIEKGNVPSLFEKQFHSITDLGLVDKTGLLYSPDYVNQVDLHKGIFCVCGIWKSFHYDELKRARNVILYENGFLQYSYRDKVVCLDKINERADNANINDSIIDYLDKISPYFDKDLIKMANGYLESGNRELIDSCVDILSRKCVSRRIGLFLSDVYSKGPMHLRNIEASIKYLDYSIPDHLSDEYYVKKIDILIQAFPNSLDDLFQIYRSLEKNNKCRQTLFDTIYARKNKEADNLLFKMIESSVLEEDYEMIARLGLMFFSGRGCESNSYEATRKLRIAYDNGVMWVEGTFFKCLFNSKNVNESTELFERSKILSIKGNKDGFAWLGKCYRYGKGTDQNFDEAKKCLLKAAELGVGWSAYEYISTLLQENTNESLSDAREYSQKMFDSGNYDGAGWLGRIYRDGRGVDRDLNCALKWMAIADEAGVGWAKMEVLQILWAIDTDESLSELYDRCKKLEPSGNKDAMGWLGRMYRDGKHVDRDMDKAAEYMRKAADGGPRWVKNDLKNIILEMP